MMAGGKCEATFRVRTRFQRRDLQEGQTRGLKARRGHQACPQRRQFRTRRVGGCITFKVRLMAGWVKER